MAAASAPVLLGLRDAAAPPRSASCSRDSPPPHGLASRLGGAPDRFPSVTLVRPACGICRAALMHVVQIYCPLEGSPFHRVINLFACAKKSCWGKAESWKALRSQYLQAEGKETQDCKLKQRQECVMETKDWCEGAEDWGEVREMAPSEPKTGLSRDLHPASALLPREVDCASQFQGLSLQEAPGILHPLRSHKPATEEHILPSYNLEFQAYYISVVEEEDYLGCNDTDHVQKLLKEYQHREGVDLEELMSESYAAGSCDEKYEKSEAEKRDQVFHKFMKSISVCPGQILRYSWGGQPLFITCPSLDVKTAVPLCNNCKSKRIFEFQLMPALVSMLKSGDGDVSVEFGTAVVYTCEKSCWPVDHPTPLEEFIFIQEDPDQQLFK
ncbi:programmed cell death protein 2-like [Hemicordylus capensis]|uniref:programmed cell death protein 2-like n=1 Tax=Hemicordylus capensis TaxID=884348 RepID=UPI0023031422|nr:programmed cell death protein 2-like [Hemicordylus capensis]